MDRNLQIATVGLLVVLILGITWIAIQLQPIVRLANSNVAQAIGGIGA